MGEEPRESSIITHILSSVWEHFSLCPANSQLFLSLGTTFPERPPGHKSRVLGGYLCPWCLCWSPALWLLGAQHVLSLRRAHIRCSEHMCWVHIARTCVESWQEKIRTESKAVGEGATGVAQAPLSHSGAPQENQLHSSLAYKSLNLTISEE